MTFQRVQMKKVTGLNELDAQIADPKALSFDHSCRRLYPGRGKKADRANDIKNP
jgi:hypothetical protein